MRPSPRPRAPIAALAAAALAVIHPATLHAVERHYIGPAAGIWNASSNWSPFGLPSPGTGDTAFLDPAYNATVTFDANYASPLAAVTLNGTAGATVTLNQSANTLLTSALTLGTGGHAAYSLSNTGTLTVSGDATLGNNASPSVISFTQSGGSHTVTGGSLSELWIGRALGSTAVYNLSGGTLAMAPGSYQEYVGYAGTATFNQTGGTHNVNSSFFTTGWTGTGNGTYNLAAGTLNVTAEQWIGYLGRGTFVNSGGAHTIGTPSANRNLWVGDQPGSTGSYALTAPAATLTVNGNLNVGSSGAATFAHSAGTATVENRLNVGSLAGPGASYSLSGTGRLQTWLTYVGLSGNASFTQSGGTHIASTALVLAENAGSTAHYSLSGSGTLSTPAESIGLRGTATFAQSGGAHTASGFLAIGVNAGASGAYALSGGSLTAGELYVGESGNASFTHNGGTLLQTRAASALYLSYHPGSVSFYSLSGTGHLATRGTVVARTGVATFAQSGGNHTTAEALSIGDQAGATGTYLLSGGTLAPTAMYVGRLGAGTLVHTGGTLTHNTSEDFIIGDQPGATGTYSLSGTASASAELAIVGFGGNALVHHSAGSFAPDHLFLAHQPTSTATYSLSGTGSLSLHSASLGISGTGSFVHTGGSFAAATSITVGNFAPTNATYSLSGTGHLSSPSLVVADAGRATFTQSGGTNAVGALYLANAATASATYLLSGGSLSAYGAIIGTHGKANFTQTGGSFNVGLIRVGDGNSTAAALSVTGGAVTADTLVVGTDYGATGTVSIAGGSITLSTDLQIHDRPGNAVTLSGGTLALPSPASLILHNNNSRFAWTGGTLSLTSGYTVDPSFSLGNLPDLTGPDITLAAGRTLATPSAALNFGSITLAGGTLAGAGTFSNHALLTGHGTLAQPLTNHALLAQSDGNLAISAPLTNSPSGTIQLAPGRITSLSSPLTNSGALHLNNASITGTGTLTNAPGALLTGPGTISTATFSNAGTLVLPAGQTRTPAFANAGIAQLDSLAAILAVDGTLTNTGTLEGRGRVSASTILNSSGTLEPTAGTLTLAAPLNNAAAGTVRITAGTKLLLTSPVANAGSIVLTGGTLDSSNQTLTNTGTLSVAAGLSTIAAPLVNNGNSDVIVTGNATAVFTRPVNNASPSAEFRVSAGSTAVFLAPVTGPGPFTGTGAKHFESGPSAPASLATGGSTLVLDAASLTTAYLSESSLTAHGPVTLTPDSPASALATLTLSPTGSLDLTNNPLHLQLPEAPHAHAGFFSQIRNYLLSEQLLSSRSTPTHSLGYLPTGSTLTIQLTPIGDANLDGSLTPDDFTLLDRGFATSGQFWWQGDFNYDGQINQQDYLLIDTAYLLTTTQGWQSPNPSFLAQRASQFGSTYVSQLLTSIPEPTTLLSTLFFLLSSPLLPRRRK